MFDREGLARPQFVDAIDAVRPARLPGAQDGVPRSDHGQSLDLAHRPILGAQILRLTLAQLRHGIGAPGDGARGDQCLGQPGEVAQRLLPRRAQRTRHGIHDAERTDRLGRAVQVRHPDRHTGIEAGMRIAGDEGIDGEAWVLGQVGDHHQVGRLDGLVAKGDLTRHLAGQGADARLDPEPVAIGQGQRRDRTAQHIGRERNQGVELRLRFAVKQGVRLQGGEAAFFIERRWNKEGSSHHDPPTIAQIILEIPRIC